MMFALWVGFSAGLVVGMVTTALIFGVDKVVDWARIKR